MLDTDNNINNINSISEHNPPPPHQKQLDLNYTSLITFKDLIHFKDDIIESLNEFQVTLKKYFVSQFIDFNNKLTSLSTEQQIHSTKLSTLFSNQIDSTKLDKIDSLSTSLSKANSQLITHEIKLTTCERDISNACYKYDKIFIDNLTIPGTLGQSCKYRNLREYLLNNAEQLSNMNNNISKAMIDLKSYKTKIDALISKLTFQIETNKTYCVDYTNKSIATKEVEMERNKEEVLFTIEGLKIENNKQTKMLIENSQQLKNELEVFKQNKSEMLNELNMAINKTKDIHSVLSYDYEVIKKEIKETKKAIVDIVNIFNNNNSSNKSKDKKEKIKNDIIANFNNTIASLINQIASEQYKHLLDKNNTQDNIESYIKKYINGKMSLGAIMKPKRRKTENNVLNFGLHSLLSSQSNLDLILKSNDTEDNEEQHNNPIRRTVSMHRKSCNSTSNLFNNLYKQNTFSQKGFANNNNNNIIEEDELMLNTPKKENEEDNNNNNKVKDDDDKHREIFEYANTKYDEKGNNISHEVVSGNIGLNNDIDNINANEMFNSCSNIERNPLQNKLITNINKEEIKTIKCVDSDKSDIKIKSKFHNKNSNTNTNTNINTNTNTNINTNTNTNNNIYSNKKTIHKRFPSASPPSKYYPKPKSSSLTEKHLPYLKEEPSLFSKLNKTKSFLSSNPNTKEAFSHKPPCISRNIYLSQDDSNNYEDIPLVPKSLYTFRLDSSRSPLENRVIEFEFFTKKKFDELVSEIKKYLPIHFNSHLKNYNVIDKELERKVNKYNMMQSETNTMSSPTSIFTQSILNTTCKQQYNKKNVNAFNTPQTSSVATITKVKYNSSSNNNNNKNHHNNYKIFKKAKNLSQNDIHSNWNNNVNNISVIRDKLKKQEKPKVFVSRILTNSPRKKDN